MRLTAGLDSGPVCAQVPEPIAGDDTYGTLSARLAQVGGELLVRTLGDSPGCTDQDEAGVTYAEKISPGDRRLDPARPAVELERVVRALAPHIGAQVALDDDSLLGVRAARVVAGEGLRPGAVSFEGARPVLATADGALELVEVVPPGRRPMSGEEFVRGRRGRSSGRAA
jgi:methionyl-tRNA formyltransferase